MDSGEETTTGETPVLLVGVRASAGVPGTERVGVAVVLKEDGGTNGDSCRQPRGEPSTGGLAEINDGFGESEGRDEDRLPFSTDTASWRFSANFSSRISFLRVLVSLIGCCRRIVAAAAAVAAAVAGVPARCHCHYHC